MFVRAVTSLTMFEGQLSLLAHKIMHDDILCNENITLYTREAVDVSFHSIPAHVQNSCTAQTEEV